MDEKFLSGKGNSTDYPSESENSVTHLSAKKSERVPS